MAIDRKPRIKPSIVLRQIIIDLPPHGLPVVQLVGGVDTKDRRIGRAATEAAITTQHVPPSGWAFIREMLEAFTPPLELDAVPSPASTPALPTAPDAGASRRPPRLRHLRPNPTASNDKGD